MPRPAPARRAPVLPAVLLGAALAAGCTGGEAPDPEAGASPGPAAAAPAPAASTSVTLPPDPLTRYVPAPDDVPTGLLPVVSGSGPRDLAAVAAFSGDPATAATALRVHGFRRAYVAQYAEQAAQGRVLSAVVAEFATLRGAADDLAGDVAAGGAQEPAQVGEGGSLRVQPLPGGRGELTVLRFRVGVRTFLLAVGAPQADRALVERLGELLAERATPA